MRPAGFHDTGAAWIEDMDVISPELVAFDFGARALLTLFVVIDPAGLVPVFVSLAGGRSPQAQASIARRATAVRSNPRRMPPPNYGLQATVSGLSAGSQWVAPPALRFVRR